MIQRSHPTLASKGVGPITVPSPMKQAAKQTSESEKGSKPTKVNRQKRSTCALQCDEPEPVGLPRLHLQRTIPIASKHARALLLVGFVAAASRDDSSHKPETLQTLQPAYDLR